MNPTPKHPVVKAAELAAIGDRIHGLFAELKRDFPETFVERKLVEVLKIVNDRLEARYVQMVGRANLNCKEQ